MLLPEERQTLLEEYKVLVSEIFEQGNAVWLVNSVLVASSVLMITQASISRDELGRIVFGVFSLISVGLVFCSLLFYTFTERVKSIRWKRVNEIERILGIEGNRRIFDQVQEKWWYPLRAKMWYVLYLFLLLLFVLTATYYFVSFPT